MTIALHDAEVASRFDLLAGRFKAEVASTDCRLIAVLRALGECEAPAEPHHRKRGSAGASHSREHNRKHGSAGASRSRNARPERPRVLDLGCGKGRFARHLTQSGASVVGLDVSSRMLCEAVGLPRVKGTGHRLPFAAATFDAVVAIECLEHAGDVAGLLDEARRVLRPGGRLIVIDKNITALDARRPWLPSVVVKWIDERRGLWMYPAEGPVRERWFRPLGLLRMLRDRFESAVVDYLLSPDEADRAVFRLMPRTRKLACWTADVPGGDR